MAKRGHAGAGRGGDHAGEDVEVGKIAGNTIGQPTGKTKDQPMGATKITGSKNRILQVRKARPTEWTKTAQTKFLAALAMTGNVTTSVAVVGMSVGGAYNRRASDPAFAAGWQAALLQGYERLEALLLATTLAALDRGGGEDLVGAAQASARAGAEGAGAEGGGDRGDRGDCGDSDLGHVGVPGPAGFGAAAPGSTAAGSGTAGSGRRGVGGRGGQAVPGAGLIQLSSVTAIQFALAMLNQHRADLARGRKANQSRRATSAETDAVLEKLLDSLARRRARTA